MDDKLQPKKHKGFQKGHETSEETRRKISETRKQRFASGEIVHPLLGKHHSEKARKKMSDAKQDFIPWNKGVHDYFSEEARANISAGRKGKPAWNSGVKNCFSEETLEKISATSAGRVHSEETRQRIGNSLKNSDKVKRGSENNFYVDGRSSNIDNPYPQDWTNQLKNAIRNRDQRKCRLCGKHEVDNRKQLHVHHIDYNKNNLDPKNLISLCNKCHIKTNCSRRKFWSSVLSKLDDIKLNNFDDFHQSYFL